MQDSCQITLLIKDASLEYLCDAASEGLEVGTSSACRIGRHSLTAFPIRSSSSPTTEGDQVIHRGTSERPQTTALGRKHFRREIVQISTKKSRSADTVSLISKLC